MKRIIFILMLVLCSPLIAQISDPFGNVTHIGAWTNLISRVTVNGLDASVGDVIMARVNDEIRAKTNLVSLSPQAGVGRTFPVQSRPDEIIEFQLWRNSTQTIMLSVLQLPSAPGGSYGTATNPLIINFTIQTLTISGTATLNGAPLPGIEVMPMFSNPEYKSYYSALRTNAAGRYAMPGITHGSNIMILATSSLYFFDPPNYSFPFLNSNQTANFVAGAHPTIAVSGRITWNGEGVPGVNVWGTTTTNTTGHYSFEIVQNSTTTITPTKLGWTFTPAAHTVTFITSPQTVNFTGSPQMFTISGNTGEPGTSVTYTSGVSGSSSVISDASGDYTIHSLAHGDNVVLTPSKAGFTYSPSSATVTNITANAVRNFSATQINYTVSVTITDAGLPLGGVQLYNGSTLIPATYSAGVYTFSIPHGTTMTITPIRDGFNFDPINATITNISSPIAITFLATAVPRHTVDATVFRNSIGFAGVNMAYSVAGGVSGNVITNAAGIAAIELNQTTANITFTPTVTGYNMTPTSRTMTGLSADTDIYFTATIQTFTVTGNAGMSGVTISITGDHTNNVTTNATGDFTIPNVPWSSDIVITPSLPGWTFSPTSFAVNSIVDNVSLGDIFTATPITYIVSVYCEDWNSQPIENVIVNYGGLTTGATNSSGIFEFSAIWGTDVNVRVSKSGHVFDVNMDQIPNITDDASLVFTSREPAIFKLSGRILLVDSSPLMGVEVVAGPNSATTDIAGDYEIDIFEADSFLVIPTLVGYQFSPEAYQVSNVDDHVIDKNFVADIAKYMVRGIALKNNQPLADVLFTLNGIETHVSTSEGEFEFEIEHGSSVNIVPTKLGHTFTPSAFNLPNLVAPISNILFHAIVDSFLVSGYVLLNGATGFPVGDVRIRDQISDRFVYTGADGRYFFYAHFEDDITLVAEKDWFTFTPAQIEIINIISALPNRNFAAAGVCADVVFTVHGADFNPQGIYLTPITVELSSATTGADIYYTFDGLPPNPATGILYTEPIAIGLNSGRLITAQAVNPPLYSPSTITSGLFRVTGYAHKPVFSVATGEYTTAQTVFISTKDDGDIFYTLDGSMPTNLSAAYSDSLFINKNAILRAISYRPDYPVLADSIAIATYQIHHVMRFEFPPIVYMNEETGSFLHLDLVNYLEDSVAGNHEYTATLLSTPTNLTIRVDSPHITITPNANWSGTERIEFKLEYIPLNLPGMLPVLPIYNVAIDSLIVEVSPNQSDPTIVGYFPEESSLSVPWNSERSFWVTVSSTIPITYTWFKNGINQNNDSSLLSTRFLDIFGTTVRVIVTATDFHWEFEWFVEIDGVSDDDETIAAINTRLYENYPNPFNPETLIRFNVGAISTSSTKNGHGDMSSTRAVTLSVFNIRGQLVRRLVDDEFAPGEYSVVWNGFDDTGRAMSSGIYFYKMTTSDGYNSVRKMILLK
jgi:hypothetical protein